MSLSERYRVAAGALLHDLGKFRQRTGEPGSHAEIGARLIDEFEHLFPYEWLDDLRNAVGDHHRSTDNEIAKFVRLADWLSAGERQEGVGLVRREPFEAALVPVTAEVELLHDPPGPRYGFPLRSLSLDEDCIFPRQGIVHTRDDYSRLWERFRREAAQVGRLEGRHQFVTLLALLRKYLAFVPSATPWEEDEEHRTLPDVSLYDHLKVAAAIAACLPGVMPDTIDALLRREEAARSSPVCLAVRGDLSGIQAFLYRITEAEAEGKGSAKRLRGRSLYLALLTEAIGEAVLRASDLPACNLLYCGGGRLDLLAPLGSEAVLQGFILRLERWLLREFGGTLGFQIVSHPVRARDFSDYGAVFEALDAALTEAKRRKFGRLLGSEGLAVEPVYHLCAVCQLTPLPDPGTCALCDKHWEGGQAATRADYVLWTHQSEALEAISPTFRWADPIGLDVYLLREADLGRTVRTLARSGIPATVVRLNETDFLEPAAGNRGGNLAWGFRFLANTAPIDPDGSVLEFGDIASLARGAPYLGVLKADMDRLGLIFRRGIAAPSISRLAALSSQLDLFFCGWLNRLCHRTSAARPGGSANVFYTVYAGGDDVFVLGPWDGVVQLARAIEADFRRLCCDNSDLTISAALLFIPPHFPVARFADLAAGELEEAKGSGRNAVRLFGETVRWAQPGVGMDHLLALGEELAEAIEKRKVPRTLVHDLVRLHDQYFRGDGREDLGWTYRALYTIARRVSQEVVSDLDLLRRIPEAMPQWRVPASYVGLATRRR